MVVKIMRWRPWPPLISRKYEVKLTVKRLECGDWVPKGAEKDSGALSVEIRWMGPKISLGSFRRTVKRNCTREETMKRVGEDDDGQNDGVLVVDSGCGFGFDRDVGLGLGLGSKLTDLLVK